MKKIILKFLFVISLILGISLFTFKDFKNDFVSLFKPSYKVTAFQVGAYSAYNEALQCQKNHPNSMIYRDEEIYRVIISILGDSEAISNMQGYFNENKINYYLKKIEVSNEFYTELAEYDRVVLLASSNAYDAINDQILNIYESFENDKKI